MSASDDAVLDELAEKQVAAVPQHRERRQRQARQSRPVAFDRPQPQPQRAAAIQHHGDVETFPLQCVRTCSGATLVPCKRDSMVSAMTPWSNA